MRNLQAKTRKRQRVHLGALSASVARPRMQMQGKEQLLPRPNNIVRSTLEMKTVTNQTTKQSRWLRSANLALRKVSFDQAFSQILLVLSAYICMCMHNVFFNHGKSEQYETKTRAIWNIRSVVSETDIINWFIEISAPVSKGEFSRWRFDWLIPRRDLVFLQVASKNWCIHVANVVVDDALADDNTSDDIDYNNVDVDDAHADNNNDNDNDHNEADYNDSIHKDE